MYDLYVPNTPQTHRFKTCHTVHFYETCKREELVGQTDVERNFTSLWSLDSSVKEWCPTQALQRWTPNDSQKRCTNPNFKVRNSFARGFKFMLFSWNENSELFMKNKINLYIFLGHLSHSGDLLLWVGVRYRPSPVNIFTKLLSQIW